MGLFALWTTYFSIWRLNLLSNQKRQRIFIQAHLAIACKPSLKSVRYLVLLFLVWKPYWNMAASTLLRFFRSSNGMDSTLRLTSALSTCSFLKYLYDFLHRLPRRNHYRQQLLPSPFRLLSGYVCNSLAQSLWCWLRIPLLSACSFHIRGHISVERVVPSWWVIV